MSVTVMRYTYRLTRQPCCTVYSVRPWSRSEFKELCRLESDSRGCGRREECLYLCGYCDAYGTKLSSSKIKKLRNRCTRRITDCRLR